MNARARGPRRRVSDDVEIVSLTPAQYRRERQRALDSLGLTYDELRDQARRGEFSSPKAQMLWVAIGDSRR